MTEEPHAVVRLLLKRMESHPEEFRRDRGAFLDRWAIFVSDIDDFGSTEDKAVMREAMRKFRMDEIHEAVMNELVNGPDRRREEEEREYAQQKQMQQKQMLSQQGYGYTNPNTWGAQDQNALLAQSMNRTKEQYAANILNSPMTSGTVTTSAVTPDTWGTAQINSLKKALGL